VIEKKALRSCPICSEEYTTILHNQKFILPEGHPLENGYDVVSCRSCGFVYADVQVTQGVYDVFYAQLSKYGDTRTSTGGGQDSLDTARLKETARIIASAIPDRNIRIIDIGCANGGLLWELHILGYQNLFGVDPAIICVENTQSRSGIEAIVGSLSKIPKNLGKFDLIILSHVLEHVQDINQAVFEITHLISENGSVFVEVPDATRYADQVIAPFQEFNTEHINHFSVDAVRNLFAKIKFVPVQEASRTIVISNSSSYPVVHSILRKGKIDTLIRFDENLNANILRYIAKSKELLDKLDQRLSEILANHPKVIVWGTGQLAMKLLADTRLGKANIVNFVDGNPINQGKIIMGKSIISPLDLKTMEPYPIIITTLLHHQSIQDDIQQAGLLNLVYTLE
jgi:2-polyprenyl-3-methyl-5-hydroxy-6-metoxy-1,4-benzoquinol methylase